MSLHIRPNSGPAKQITSIYLGSTKIGAAYFGSHCIYQSTPVIVLPANTLRMRFSDGYTPSSWMVTLQSTQISTSPNIWDVTVPTTNWEMVFYYNSNLLEVIAAGDTSSVTSMKYAFSQCTNLTSICLFDTSNVTDVTEMFRNDTYLTQLPLFNTQNVTIMNGFCNSCYAVTTIPLFNTSKVTNMNNAFSYCRNASGFYQLYVQASTQATPPSQHSATFKDCGVNVGGGIELSMIPGDWK